MATDVNITLSDNLIGVSVWGIYVLIIFTLFNIPTGTITMIVAGLAAGIGMALKDIMNNFIYGIQLMSGRLRKGDWIECDGQRGCVTEINYQCTQIETTDGAILSFLNADLLGRNFKNLTKNDNYELNILTVGIAYGSNFEKVRTILLEALQKVQSKDSYGQYIIEPKYGFQIAFSNFGDSSVDVSVKMFIHVSYRADFRSLINETIYNTLNENNISIPFPQRDIHIIKEG